MTWVRQWGRSLGLALLAMMLLAPSSGFASPLARPEAVFGVASGRTDDDGAMTPTGSGRFTVDDRVYVGKSLGRSMAGSSAACFTGELRAVDDWSLEMPKMVGSHRSSLTIRSELGTLTLSLRGEMEFPVASGRWEIVRGTGDCEDVEGEGQYTATFGVTKNAPGSDFRLTFDGETTS